MKKSLKLSILLVCYLLSVISCVETRDPSEKIVYSFEPDLFIGETINVGKESDFYLKLNSNVYKNGVLSHEGIFTDDKESFLISPQGDKILPNQEFIIPKTGENITYGFYSKELGEHNLKFKFKNSMGYSTSIDKKVLVEKGDFSFSVFPWNRKGEVDNPIILSCSVDTSYDDLNHSYDIKFDVEGDHVATLNNHGAGEWFKFEKTKIDTGGTEIVEVTVPFYNANGKISTPVSKPYYKGGSILLSYKPKTVGTHNVKVTMKNDLGAENTQIFTVESEGPAKPTIVNVIQKNILPPTFTAEKHPSNDLYYVTIKNLSLHIEAKSNTSSNYVKGSLVIFNCVLKEFLMKDTNDGVLQSDINIRNHFVSLPHMEYDTFFPTVPFTIRLTNSDGGVREFHGLLEQGF